VKQQIYLFLFAIIIICIFSCKEKKPTSNEEINESATTTFIDSATNSTQDSFIVSDSFNLNLSGATTYKQEQLLLKSKDLNSDKAIENYYEQFLLLEKELNQDLLLQYKSIKNDSIKILFTIHCDSLASNLKLCGFQYYEKNKTPQIYISNQKAILFCKKTSGINDDNYFKFLNSYYTTDGSKNYILSNNLLELNKHIYNKMGDNSTSNILQQLYFSMLQSSLFKKQYQKIYDKIWEDIFIEKYAYSKERVLTEYNKILEAYTHEAYEEERIKQRIEDIKTEETNYRFNCVNGNCN
jgi:hypothetical protein